MFGLQICRRKVRRIQVEITIVSIRLDASDGRVANRITPKKKENNSAMDQQKHRTEGERTGGSAGTSPEWWKQAVIYQIYPRSFMDSNGDGIGDLNGIRSKLGYLQRLGVDLLWLSPVYDSPNDDNGYDIRDYRAIHEEFGTMEEMEALIEEVHACGMRLVMDLVVNHTSDEHRWFREAAASRESPSREYYFWEREKPNNWPSFFGGDAWSRVEGRVDADAGKGSNGGEGANSEEGDYYLHLFSKKQPDLNWENPNVRQEVYDIMRFWLDMGVDGFRMDVIPLISKRTDWPDADLRDFNRMVEETYANGPRVHEFLQEMRREVLDHYDAVAIGEGIGVTHRTAPLYVNRSRKELDFLFHFDHTFIDHGPGGRFDPVPYDLQEFKRVFFRWDRALAEEGWNAIYLDNHDCARLVSRFGNDGEHWRESATLFAMLLMTMRGTPAVYQGTELGMTNAPFERFEDFRDVEVMNAVEGVRKRIDSQGRGKDGGRVGGRVGGIDGGMDSEMDVAGVITDASAENGKKLHRELASLLKALQVAARDHARTPMQWSASEGAGFTTGSPWILINPNKNRIHAEAQLEDPDSVFHFYRRMIEIRREYAELVTGSMEWMDGGHTQLFWYRRSQDRSTCRGTDRSVGGGGNVFDVVLNMSDEEVLLPESLRNRDDELLIGNVAGLGSVRGRRVDERDRGDVGLRDDRKGQSDGRGQRGATSTNSDWLQPWEARLFVTSESF